MLAVICFKDFIKVIAFTKIVGDLVSKLLLSDKRLKIVSVLEPRFNSKEIKKTKNLN
jgi:hypothetical protein